MGRLLEEIVPRPARVQWSGVAIQCLWSDNEGDVPLEPPPSDPPPNLAPALRSNRLPWTPPRRCRFDIALAPRHPHCEARAHTSSSCTGVNGGTTTHGGLAANYHKIRDLSARRRPAGPEVATRNSLTSGDIVLQARSGPRVTAARRHVIQAPARMSAANAHIRNFSIIAHIDHGKSTLADRLLEETGTVTEREQQAQFLDNMELERERGITIKAQTVRMRLPRQGRQGLPAQPHRHPRARRLRLRGLALAGRLRGGAAGGRRHPGRRGADPGQRLPGPRPRPRDRPGHQQDRPAQRRRARRSGGRSRRSSASTPPRRCPARPRRGSASREILEQVVKKVPPPKGDPERPAQGPHLRLLVRHLPRRGHAGARLRGDAQAQAEDPPLVATSRSSRSRSSGSSPPSPQAVPQLMAGEVGVCVANVKDVHDAKVGDTITDADRPVTAPFPGFKEVKPMVFSGIFPIDAADYEQLRDALDKLQLNDSAFTFEPETSQALGFGFRCGYLGLLHMEIVQERLEREYNLALITTAPSVVYRVTDTQGEVEEIDNPAKLPPVQRIAKLEEPILTCHIHVPDRRRGRHPQALPGPARRAEGPEVHRRQAGADHLRDPARRGGLRLLRQAQERLPRLRLARLRAQGLPGGRPRQARHPHQRRAGRRPLRHRAPRERLLPGPRRLRRSSRR